MGLLDTRDNSLLTTEKITPLLLTSTASTLFSGDSGSISSGRNAALALSPAQQKAYRDVVVRDIIDSEQAHVAELQTLSTNFLQPLEKAPL